MYGRAVSANRNVTDDMGQGIRALVMSRLQQANAVTVLDRNPAVEEESKDSQSASVDPGRGPE